MSEPTRYEAMGLEVIATPTGEFVLWEDYARLKDELASLRSQFANSEWQPIETAPKDCKTQILAWCKEYDHLFIVNYTGSEGMWYVSSSEGYIRPTHWMSLPKPPIS